MYRNYTRIKLFAGGVSLKYLGRGAIAFIVCKVGSYVLEKKYWLIDSTTNHRASYSALIEGLKFVRRYNPTFVYCYLENKMVVHQLKGGQSIRSSEFQLLKETVSSNEKYFGTVNYSHVKNTHPQIAEVQELIHWALYGNVPKDLF